MSAAVSLIIPCHNEENRLSGADVLDCLKLLGDGAEIVLVDDGSTDGTSRLLKKIAASSPAVRAFTLPENMGKAEAVRSAMADAAERKSGYVGFCDADFAAPPEEVARVFSALRESPEGGAAAGTRNSPLSENINRTPVRRLLSGIFSAAASFVLRRRVSDSQCGAKFFKNTPALQKALSEPFISRWGFDVELLGRIEADRGTAALEVPLKRWEEKSRSRMNPVSMAATLFELREINGALEARRKAAGNRAGLTAEIFITLFIRLIPLYAMMYVFTKILFWDGYWVNPDSYYHLGLANTYKEMGWLSSFPWLPYTVIADPFPNLYLLQHLFLAFVGAFVPDSPDPQFAIKTVILAMGFIQMLSVYLFLRKWNVGNASLWVVIGITASSNMIWHTIALKGITTFTIMLPWIVDALWSDNNRRALILGFLSSYSYVGFIILGPLAACRAAGHLIFDGKLKIKTPLMLGAGVAAGMILSPFFPDNLSHIYRELNTIFERPAFIKAGDFYGLEWQIPGRIQLQHFLGSMLLSTIAATFFYMRKNSRADSATGAAFIAVFVFALFPFVGGVKFAQIFSLLSCLMVPLIYREVAASHFRISRLPFKIKPVLAVLFAFVFLVYSLPFIKQRQVKGKVLAPTPRAYAGVAETVRKLTDKGKVVVAPWDDFPGLFYFNRDNRYISGMNNLFLYKGDSNRFTSYYRLFKGGVANPAESVPVAFDNADLILIRNTPRNKGESDMLKMFDKAPGLARFEGEGGNVRRGNGVVDGFWRAYKIVR